MTLKHGKGSIFNSTAQVIVNPVNCVGVMGKGLALEFKKRFPEYFKDYKEQCELGNIKLGDVEIYFDHVNDVVIASFPTKGHWRDKSKLSDIEDGLPSLEVGIRYYDFKSVALPMLGCGQGGLKEIDVLPLIIEFSDRLPGVTVELWIP